MKENILVIDIGTQSLRASVISKKGECLIFSKKEYDPPFVSPKKGFAEQNADLYIDKLCEATNEIYQKDKDILLSISGMVCICFRDSSVILDENKKPLRNAILWLDQRIEKIPHMSNLKFYEKLIFSVIGMKDTAKYNAERTPIYWIRKNQPELYKKMRYYCPLGAYFNYRITGNLKISSADCIGHYPVNFKKDKYYSKHHPKTSIFSIPVSSLPEIVPVSTLIGRVTEKFSSLSKIPVGTPLLASASDKACETLGDGCIDEKEAAISLGTACTIDVAYRKYKEPETFLPSYPAPYKGDYNLEVQIYRGFYMIRWYLDEFGKEDRIEAEKLNMKAEQYLDEKIKDIPAGSDGLILQPYWGPGLKRPNARGSIIGFSSAHTRHHIYKAIIEGIAFSLKEGLDKIIKKTHRKPDTLIISGGGSQSESICQIFADVFGIKTMMSPTKESATLGAAMSGFISLGIYANSKEAKDNMLKKGKILQVNEKKHSFYQKMYNTIYKKIYPSLKKSYYNLKNLFLTQDE